ncbi:PilN domain-containing protein [Psychrobium sp. MM17-31]|uniref:PilN domain-containing protein n=1 Tax=Psychrobium sp. MM17-31 TaxID=2917758 RepID=UPI001EF45067|nr:PilN domain-containing protein [Psychrobium sp. MM17-31]MCG7531451.1 PilN domain-containing protein [Psychrobium sp. MM17-31]
MKSRINLYLPELRPVKEVLPLSQSVTYMALSLFVAVLVIGGFTYLNQQLKADNQRFQSELRLQEAILGDKSNELAAVTTNSPLLNDIKAAKAKTAEKKVILATLRRSFDRNDGFSALFEGLSNIDMNGVWLTAIESRNGQLSFAGSALKSQAIPRWVEAMEQSPVFSGHSFAGLEIQREDDLVNFTLQNSGSTIAEESQ